MTGPPLRVRSTSSRHSSYSARSGDHASTLRGDFRLILIRRRLTYHTIAFLDLEAEAEPVQLGVDRLELDALRKRFPSSRDSCEVLQQIKSNAHGEPSSKRTSRYRKTSFSHPARMLRCRSSSSSTSRMKTKAAAACR